MSNNLKQLQTQLAKDLIEMETQNVAEEHTDLIEETYAKVYNILSDLIIHTDNTPNNNKPITL